MTNTCKKHLSSLHKAPMENAKITYQMCKLLYKWEKCFLLEHSFNNVVPARRGIETTWQNHPSMSLYIFIQEGELGCFRSACFSLHGSIWRRTSCVIRAADGFREHVVCSSFHVALHLVSGIIALVSRLPWDLGRFRTLLGFCTLNRARNYATFSKEVNVN